MNADEVTQAMWDGDMARLYELAPCECCCAEHFFESCPARAWNGCRGQNSITFKDIEGWADHYKMTVSEFLTGEP